MKKYFTKYLFWIKLLDDQEKRNLQFAVGTLAVMLLIVASLIATLLPSSTLLDDDSERDEKLTKAAGISTEDIKSISTTKLLGLNKEIVIRTTVVPQVAPPIVDLSPVILNGYILSAVMDVGNERKAIVNTPDGQSLYLKHGGTVANYRVVKIDRDGLSLVQESDYGPYLSNPSLKDYRIYRILTR